MKVHRGLSKTWRAWILVMAMAIESGWMEKEGEAERGRESI